MGLFKKTIYLRFGTWVCFLPAENFAEILLTDICLSIGNKI